MLYRSMARVIFGARRSRCGQQNNGPDGILIALHQLTKPIRWFRKADPTIVELADGLICGVEPVEE